MTKKKDLCSHDLRSAQSVNFIRDGGMCLLPLELLTCMRCANQSLLWPEKNMIIPHPSSGSRRLLDQLVAKATEARSEIIKPEEPKLIV